MLFKHLLPKAKAWSITQTKRLREFFVGLSGIEPDFKEFADDVILDVFPETTRELDAWEDQFVLPENTSLTESVRRERLSAAWKVLGGQDIKYIQGTLRDAGFDVYVHEWWSSPGPPPVARNPHGSVIGNNYMLVNIIIEQTSEITSLCGESSMECGEPLAECGEYNPSVFGRKKYPVPGYPAQYPYIIYIGGETYPNNAQVPLSRKDELEALLLKICPSQQWIGMLITYTVPFVELTVPAESGSYEATTPLTIDWNFFGLEGETLTLDYDIGAGWVVLATGVPIEDYTYPWTVPNSVGAGKKFRVTSNLTAHTDTNTFEITPEIIIPEALCGEPLMECGEPLAECGE